jgi:hypothetical protein
MMSEEIFNDASVDAGWTPEQEREVLLKYIDGFEDDDAFRIFLEDEATGTDAYRQKHKDDEI